MNRWTGIMLGIVVAIIALVLLGVVAMHRFLNQPVQLPEGGIEFEIAQGSAFRHVSDDLAAAGVIRHAAWFRWYARFTGEASQIHAGEYRLEAGDTPMDILQKFVSGQVKLYSFTIIEGWNYRELLAAMRASDVIRSTIVYEDWPAVLASFGSEATHPEGLFLPETYRFPRDSTDVDVLHQAYLQMQETLAEEWQGRSENVPLDSPYEALILASIIEKETARADERPLISGVFVRRLQSRMRLQTDPTVIYGIGPDFDGNITRKHLQTDTPYNTYTRRGLPPTPIAMAGRAAINAALHPAEGNELFFVATGLGDGSHKFSATKAEHDIAVREYLARQRANRNRRQGN